MSAIPEVPERSPAPAVTRAAAILRLLGEQGPTGMTEIARTLSLAKSSTLNLLVALEQENLVRKDGSSYVLGRATVELGGAYVRGFDVVREFTRLSATDEVLHRELLHLAVLHETEVLYLARHEGRHPLRLSANVGDRFPASITAVGNILLAELSDDEVRERFADPGTLPVWTEHSVRTLDDLLAKLQATRERGHSVDDRETNPGVFGMAVLVPPRKPGDVPMALGTSMMYHLVTPGERERMLQRLLAARDELSSPRLLSQPN
ncbi:MULTISPECIES: IclR family transcriptional regulator [unclassified Luteococcus]|uniref:IclR family transcriptional regulator n=1 Tax=unclassified Luteococcus TaxID=2639923 RepID=UPI00313E012F